MAATVRTIPGQIDPLGYEQITSLSGAASLTVPAGAKWVRIVCHTQAVRWRDDGTAPTATVGMPLPVDTIFDYGGDLNAIQFIQQTASAELNVTYYG